MASRAWEALRIGEAQRAFDLTRRWNTGPAVAAVHLAASLRVQHTLETAALCGQAIPRALGSAAAWGKGGEVVLRTCGWHLIETRTHRTLGIRAARYLLRRDPYDHDARGLLAALQAMDELPQRKWKPPRPGGVKQRRKRDFRYLYRYLRPEDGSFGPDASWAVLPDRAGSQARLGAHGTFHLRDHERVPLGYRVVHNPPGEGATSGDAGRGTTHQVQGGYDVRVLRNTPLLLDSSLILGEGRDEGVVRFRVERIGLGVWSADSAVAWTPWGSHGALRLGWDVTLDGLASFDLDVEGQAGAGGPRGLARLGVYRRVGRSTARLEGQLGQATRPLTPRWLLRDLPGVEGAGAGLSLTGPLADYWWLSGRLEVVRLHPDLGDQGATAGVVETSLLGYW